MAAHSRVRLIVDRLPIRVNRKQHHGCGGGSGGSDNGARVCLCVRVFWFTLAVDSKRPRVTIGRGTSETEAGRCLSVFGGWVAAGFYRKCEPAAAHHATASDPVRVSLSLSLSKRERKEIIIKADQRRGMDKEWDGMTW